MPQYTTINRLQCPVLTDPPNAVAASQPLASGVERRSMLRFTTKSDRAATMRNPSPGQITYIADFNDVQIFTNGMWVSATPRVVQLGEVNVPDTNNVVIVSFPVENNSVYNVSGFINTEVSTGSITIEPLVANQLSGYYRLNLNSTETVNTAQAYSDTSSMCVIHGLGFTVGAAATVFQIHGRRSTASGTGGIVDGFLFVSRIGDA